MPAVAGPMPEVRVTHIRRVFHNGEHNAFTDLVRFQDKFYLTFRSCPDGHMVHPTASIIILASTDAKQWRQVHRFSVAKRDTRDPHFLVFENTLFVHTGTWYCGETSPKPADYDLNRHLGYAAWSKDGVPWHSPIMLEGTFGHYIWRAGAFGGKAYLCGRGDCAVFVCAGFTTVVGVMVFLDCDVRHRGVLRVEPASIRVVARSEHRPSSTSAIS